MHNNLNHNNVLTFFHSTLSLPQIHCLFICIETRTALTLTSGPSLGTLAPSGLPTMTSSSGSHSVKDITGHSSPPASDSTGSSWKRSARSDNDEARRLPPLLQSRARSMAEKERTQRRPLPARRAIARGSLDNMLGEWVEWKMAARRYINFTLSSYSYIIALPTVVKW